MPDKQDKRLIKPGDIESMKAVVYQNDILLKYKLRWAVSPSRGKREEVTEFSDKSRKRLSFVANNTHVHFLSFATLTYPEDYPHDGKRTKRDLRAFLDRVRRKYGRFSYLWFLEFQRRGAPHYHVMVDKPMHEDKQWLSQAWYEVCNRGDEKHLLAGTNVEELRRPDGCARYVTKYACKTYQKFVPPNYRNVGRMWGHSRDVKPVPEHEIEINHDSQIRSMLGQCWATDAFEAWVDGRAELPPGIVFGSTIDKELIDSVVLALSKA